MGIGCECDECANRWSSDYVVICRSCFDILKKQAGEWGNQEDLMERNQELEEELAQAQAQECKCG